MILSTAYFPPLAWFALAGQGGACLEACENYQKQSYRNRCYILGPQGPQMLQVPIAHGAAEGIREIQVDYSTPWVVRTQRALDTAYEMSAYFEYFRDEVFALLDARPERLWDLNLSLIDWCMKRSGLACKLEPSPDFAAPGSVADDYRSVIHPKHPDRVLESLGLNRPYYQVFRDRMGGFTPGLSILDLLFNEGPDAIYWLKVL